jgi:hypothetical protein
MQFGKKAVATPALIEVTSDQGLAVAESKQAWTEEDNLLAELPHTILRSINPIPTTQRISVAVPLLFTLPQS